MEEGGEEIERERKKGREMELERRRGRRKRLEIITLVSLRERKVGIDR